MLRCAIFCIALLITPVLAASPREEGYQKLTGSQIPKAFVGKQFTDNVHFSFRYISDGTIDGTSMGKKVTNK